MRILTINAGSSSVRLGLFEHLPGGELRAGAREHLDAASNRAASQLAAWVPAGGVDIVAHRVVHGGERLVRPVRIDASVRDEIRRLAPLAPLHNPRALAWMQACDAAFGPSIPQLAVFDTAFYSELPAAARTYALPRALCERHAIRRYGFHGLAHQALWRQWQTQAAVRHGRGRVISLQLGGGCSVTAMDNGRPLDTSMGFSPLEGLMMATRSGDLDPGALTYLMRKLNLPPEKMEALLNEQSGLLGVSGSSADMRVLLASPEPAARLAVELYCYRARKYIGAYLAVLGGADAILFGGGVGENAPAVRARILAGLEWAGLDLDAEMNNDCVGRTARISQAGSGMEAWVIPVDESRVLAEEAVAAMQPKGGAA